MPLRLLRKSPRRQRGQALVLGALSFLVLALMVALSFNLSHALREKVSLQQHSDSMAYSMAVVEARALNYYAVSNRAIAATYVAMNSMHAYMAAASVTGEMMRKSQTNYYIIMAMEFAQCGCWSCFKHCIHGLQALKIAGKYGKAGNKYDKRVKNLENSFNQTIQGLDRMVDFMHASQAQVHLRTVDAVRNGGSYGLEKLTSYNAPGASTVTAAVGAMNMNEFNCAVDGMPCTGSVASSDPKARSKVMTEVANASRPAWPANRGLPGGIDYPLHLHPQFLQEIRDIPGEGINSPVPFTHKGTAKTVQSTGSLHSGSAGPEGKAIAAEEQGMMYNQWKHGTGIPLKYSALVASDSGSGKHTPGGAHSGSHKFEGVNAKALTACTLGGNCFMKFRANEDKDRDYGQPRSFSYVTKTLRGASKTKAPWQLNSSATLNFQNGKTSASLTLAADEGAALSKAIVYYHRFGDNGWREAPNLFSPYWRAKLHPFTQQQAAEVLTAASNTDAAQLVSSSTGLSL
ncbi:TadE/TadG family type IV pilus assembly protein [Vitiosangium sp. GDMCC 1.1324]|uniref:TadE/TadG family type IV pilus assembly protein n=1 Tax=Vitiosangium sp. (strain GDMCC 1.1324) TaxID=2138576 RepID=UPI000D344C77|nr:hypothetical protein [Vitiosangium sp. GDMCC 1.1324]PTL85837.1 hypothetical protein DAT35_03850 [Vitiosangium sp. GDMCC 1.1324]